jgi:hypothetical protein
MKRYPFKEREEYSEEVRRLSNVLYDSCYLGHIPEEQWLRLAQFTHDYRQMSATDAAALRNPKEDFREIKRKLGFSRQGKL